jgi:hypothetical protein
MAPVGPHMMQRYLWADDQEIAQALIATLIDL